MELALDADGVGYGWHWTQMVLDANGGWARMVVGRGWWLDMDGGWMRMSRKKSEKSEKMYSWSC